MRGAVRDFIGKDRYLTVKSVIPELTSTYQYILIYQQENYIF